RAVCRPRSRGLPPVALLLAGGPPAAAHAREAAAAVFSLDDADARRPLAGRADDHHVGHGQRRRLVDDPAGSHGGLPHAASLLDRTRPHVPLHEIEVLDDPAVLAWQRLGGPALL